MKHTRLFEIDGWKLVTRTLPKEHIRLLESLTSLGNGYMGMRGNFEEDYSGDHHQGTYLAGVWFPDKTRVGWWKNGYPEYFGKVINAMNLIGLHIFVNGEAVDLYVDPLQQFELSLDMQRGLLKHSYQITKKGGTVKIELERFLNLVNKEICSVRCRVTSLSDQVAIRLVPFLDGDVRNEDANYDQQFWVEEGHLLRDQRSCLSVKTRDNPFGTPVFSVSAAMGVSSSIPVEPQMLDEPFKLSQKYDYTLGRDQQLTLDKFSAVTTSRDDEPDRLPGKSFELLDQAIISGYDELKAEHVGAWARRWEKADITIEGDKEAQQGIRFNLFQLFSTYYGEDARLNIGPKGFTGEKYGGATYWDTEAYAVPLYLALTDSEVTKQLLLYRYKQLPGAFHNARQQGLQGALFPMVTFTGVECHNEWEITFEEIHRNGAIAYAIYNYVNYTGDTMYLEQYGIDVLVAICRFWADRVHFSRRRQQYMIHGVTGPNEYENNVNNNWYTNTMAAWTLDYTLRSLPRINDQKLAILQVTGQETEHWRDIVQRMYYPKDEKLGIFVQQDTFLDKEIRPASEIPAEERPINQHWSWDKVLRSCYIKQADVLQGLYFLSEKFTKAEKTRNFDFYEPLTVHESSLSACVHSILASELGKKDKALALYKQTARLDLDDYNQDTDDGLHITSMTGSWLAIVQGFAGMRTFHETLAFSPYLPTGWTGYSFKVNYRGRLLKIQIERRNLVIQLIKGQPLSFKLYGERVVLEKSIARELPKEKEERAK
ncbi:MAG: glycoside hydrolase family 65 protein [Sporolactobacillus sp.]